MECQARILQRPHQRLVPWRGGFKNNEGPLPDRPADQGGDARRVVREATKLGSGVKIGVEAAAGDIDCNGGLWQGHGPILVLRARRANAGPATVRGG